MTSKCRCRLSGTPWLADDCADSSVEPTKAWLIVVVAIVLGGAGQYYNHSRPWITHISMQCHDASCVDLAKHNCESQTRRDYSWDSSH